MMKVAFHGHAVVSVVTKGGTKLLFDPFITGHAQCDLDVSQLEVDVILVTHAHSDHLGDTIELAKRTGALVISTIEIVTYLASQGLENLHGMQAGGAHEFAFGRVKFTPAIHGSSITLDNGQPYELGLACGILLSADNKTLYHVGDTALYSDMQLLGLRESIDLAFIPIGDNFTMGPDDAVQAAEWLQARRVVPIHYNTFPLIEQDPYAFIERLPEGVGCVPKLGDYCDL